MFPIKLSTC